MSKKKTFKTTYTEKSYYFNEPLFLDIEENGNDLVMVTKNSTIDVTISELMNWRDYE